MKAFFKKFLVSLGIIATVSTTMSFTASTPVFARNYGDCDTFLGMVTWDCHAPKLDNQSNLVSGIATIATNILTDLTVIAAYLILGYVIYGGFLYITSAGDPGKAANGKKTLIHAFIGLAIVVSAYTIFSAIRIAIIGNKPLGACVITDSTCVNPNTMVTNLVQWVFGIVGVVSALFIFIGGWGYVTSAGDPNKLQKAKQTIVYAIIGLIICALAEVITAFVSSTIRDANSYVNNSIIANINKESYEIH